MGYLESVRQKIGHALIPLAYSTVFVEDDAGRILFHHRPDFGLWGLPGGILEIGESPAECARREAFEETGLRVEPTRLAAVLSSPSHNVEYPNGDRVQQVTFFFESRTLGGALRPEGGESSRLAFFPPGDPPRTLPWYELAIRKRGLSDPFFDPPEFAGTNRACTLNSEEENGQKEIPAWKFLRRRIGKAPLLLPGATALVCDGRGRVLMIRRIDSGRWALPGGLLELGESLAGTAVRETEEETGLRVEPVRVRGVFGGHHVVFPGGDTLYPISTFFECRIRSGSLRPDFTETDRVEFHDPTDLPETIPILRERLARTLAAPQTAIFE
jgi:ADP-ribose pyrophosphatase YjhB (NUDIX family)